MKKVPFFSIISFNLYFFVKNKSENLCHIKKMIKIEIITLIIPHLIITVVVILKIGKIKKGSKKGDRGGGKLLDLFFIIYSPNEPKYTTKSVFAVKS